MQRSHRRRRRAGAGEAAGAICWRASAVVRSTPPLNDHAPDAQPDEQARHRRGGHPAAEDRVAAAPGGRSGRRRGRAGPCGPGLQGVDAPEDPVALAFHAIGGAGRVGAGDGGLAGVVERGSARAW